MTEVLEHIEYEQLINILKLLINGINFLKIILTTPNVKFNVNYNKNNMGLQYMRHKIYVHEYNKDELVNLFNSLCSENDNITYRYYSIGDNVNGESVTHAIVINNKNAFNNINMDTNIGTGFGNDNNIKPHNKQVNRTLLKLQYSANDKINYIAGTISPVPSNKNTKSDNLEDLYTGLDFLSSQINGPITFSIQPKYMGCRCNIYLFNNIKKCYVVSRNGYKINDDLTIIFTNLHKRMVNFMENNNIKLMIIDGELLPWTFLFKKLVEVEFMLHAVCMKKEAELIYKYNFENIFHSIDNQIKLSNYIQDRKMLSKNLLISKYGDHIIRMFELYIQHKDNIYSSKKLMEFCDMYREQLNLYTENTNLDYKPFCILKMVYNNGEKRIPLIDHSMSRSEMFRILNDDEQLIIELDKNTLDSKFELINKFFQLQTSRGMEGIVIKPDYVKPNEIPMIKCRNPQYLKIIYDPDYLEPHKYMELISRKSVSKKLTMSIKEYNLGLDMLRVKYDDIGCENYNKIFMEFIKLDENSKCIDTRL